jgi:hypothetical protein
MRILLTALSVLAICSGPAWARDPTTPPALGDTPDGAERSPGANPTKAGDRFQQTGWVGQMEAGVRCGAE